MTGTSGEDHLTDPPAASHRPLVVLDKVNKKFVMRYHQDRCTYCAQCVVNCRFSCLEMSNELWELASVKKEPFEVYYGKDEDVAFLLEKIARDNSGESSCPEDAV